MKCSLYYYGNSATYPACWWWSRVWPGVEPLLLGIEWDSWGGIWPKCSSPGRLPSVVSGNPPGGVRKRNVCLVCCHHDLIPHMWKRTVSMKSTKWYTLEVQWIHFSIWRLDQSPAGFGWRGQGGAVFPFVHFVPNQQMTCDLMSYLNSLYIERILWCCRVTAQ